MSTLNPIPFVKLRSRRAIDRPALPPDLAGFFASHEGVGLSSSPLRLVRIALLEEVTGIMWRDLHVVGRDDHPGWEDFAALRIGKSQFFDEIVYVLSAPVCPPGSILALGPDLSGPGGIGPAALECSVVLARNLDEWIKRLRQFDGMDFGLAAGGISDLPDAQQGELRRHYRTLNPGISWGR